jgi:Pectate lyase superfamily protein
MLGLRDKMGMARFLLEFLTISMLMQRAEAADSTRGASLPWVTYEAELANTSGTVLGPDYTGHTPAREASGRRCVRLGATGEFLEFTAKAAAEGIVVRYCIPDSSDGRGADATLSLYVNGKPRNKLPMTSRYSYLYGAYPFSNNPSSGSARHFWDELRLMPGDIHRGDVIRLQKDADDTATQYLIDFVDLEPVPGPLDKPANSVSVTEFGATANSPTDNHPAFVAAIAAAKAQHKSVWIPTGQFVVKGPLEVSDVAIRGAGMWYSALVGVDNYKPGNRVAIDGNGSNITLSDFAIIGKLNYRDDSEANDGIGGSFGTGSSLQNIWVEHTKTGAWLTNSDGLLVEGCRFRDTIADGINLCVGMRNTVVRECTVRGSGDDCFAMWPATYTKAIYPAGGNHFVNCTAQLPSLAQAFSIYGGAGNTVENCEAIDIPYGAGLYASTTFRTEGGFTGITMYRDISVVRAGDGDGAIGTVANLVDLAGLRFEDIDVIDSPTDGIKFTSMNGRVLSDTAFNRIRIVNPGRSGAGSGIVEAKGAAGSATISNVTIVNPRTGGFQNNDSAFNLIGGVGNAGVAVKEQSGTDVAAVRRISVGQ